jgi:hypothetical protein
MEKSKLQPGTYMKAFKVKEFIQNHFKFTLGDIVEKTCKIHQGETDQFYSVQDLRSVIAPDLMREMECDCVTYMITSK